MRWCIWLLLSCGWLAITGCASQPAEPRPLRLAYASKLKAIERSEDSVRPCVWVSDERRHSSFYGYDISSSDTTEWLQAGIANRLAASSEVRDAPQTKGMHVSVTKAYVNPHAQAFTGVVVLRVVWGANDQVYRGQETRTNWWGADSELQNILTVALDKALGKITLPVAKSRCTSVDTELMDIDRQQAQPTL